MDQWQADDLTVSVHDDADEAGRATAAAFAAAVQSALTERDEIAVILATGNSQLPFVRALGELDLPWDRITVFHMDEYLGMSADHPASFRRWLLDNIAPFGPKALHLIAGDAPVIEEELDRYAELLRSERPVITVMGIGENGHLAFNDPPADFETGATIHLVALDDACRQQQVGEGHFPSFEEAPARAVSLTIPALLASPTVLVLTPEARKAVAVRDALEGPITPSCPASILRRAGHAHLVLDADSASLLTTQSG